MDKYDEMLINTGKGIKAARERINWSQQKLADKACVSLRHLQNIEDGEVNLSFEKLARICETLGLSIDAFMYPDTADFGIETAHLRMKFKQCTKEERTIIIKTMDYMASQFIESREE